MPARCIALMCILSAFIVAAAVPAQSDVPRKINYQGLLTDIDTGQPLVGSVSLTFSLYDQAAGGSLLWSETKTVVADTAGVFATILGSTTPIDIPFDDPCWLEIQVEGETLSPRRELASVPYAFRALNALNALNADSLDGFSSASFALAGHLHDDVYVNEGQAGSVTAGMIVGGPGSGLDADLLDGQEAAAFSPAAHAHDERYYTEAELNTAGTVNQTSNPVEWTKLKGVPAGFADGTDNVGTGDGHSLDAADGSPTDVVYVDNAGNVGINVTEPTLGKLQVLTTAGTAICGTSNDGAGVYGFSQNNNGVLGVSNNGLAGAFVGQVYVSGRVDSDSGFSIDGKTLLSAPGTDNIAFGRRTLGLQPWSVANTCVGDSTGFVEIGSDNTFIGYNAGHGTDPFPKSGAEPTTSFNDRNVFVGCRAGYSNYGSYNVFVGRESGLANTSGSSNTLVGAGAGRSVVDGNNNLFLGVEAGQDNISGDLNVLCGPWAGSSREAASENTYVGYSAGGSNFGGLGETGDQNTAVGAQAGMNADGSRNVFLGYGAGYGYNGSDKLFIANGKDTSDVLIYGNFDQHRVGIGTTSPIHSLDIESAKLSDWITLNSTSPDAVVGFGLGNGTRHWALDVRGDRSDVLAIMDVTAQEFRFAIDTAGRVGIGTTSPERLLHLKSDGPRVLVEATGGNPEINFKTAGDPTGEVWAIYKHSVAEDLRFYQNGDRVTLQNSTGNMAIGATDPAGYRLYVNGQAYATLGWQPSDLRLKTDLQGIDDALGKIVHLNGVSFRWRTEDHPDRGFPEGRHYGLVAQEVEEVLPEAVGNGFGDEKALAYSELIPVLVEAVKQLKAENDALRARLDALEN